MTEIPMTDIIDRVASRFSKRSFFVALTLGVLAVIGLTLVFGCWFVTEEGYRTVVTRNGAADRATKPGLNFKLPWFESAYPVSVRADAVNVDKAEGSTSDTQPVHTSLVVRYEINPEAVIRVFSQYDRSGDMDRYVQTATAETFKAVTGHFTAPELITKRSDAATQTVSTLQSKMDQYGIRILSVDMTNFAFSNSYMGSIEAKVKAEQDVLTEQQILARQKIEQQSKVQTAEAEAAATRAQADAAAYRVTVDAKAKAAAIAIEANALQNNPQLLDLRRIEVEQTKATRWNGALPSSIYAGAPIPFLNVGTAGKP
jgi:prohibitin 2